MLVRVRSESPVPASHEVKRKTTTPRLDRLRIAESIPLTPLSHNIPRRARTVHAKDDETIVEIASRLEFDLKKLMKLNRVTRGASGLAAVGSAFILDGSSSCLSLN